MNSRIPFIRETACLLLPVAAFAVAGYLLRRRETEVVIPPPKPFTLYIKSWKMMAPSPVDVFGGYDTRVVVQLGATGKKPNWWREPIGIVNTMPGGDLVAYKDGMRKVWSGNVVRWGPERQPDGNWTIEYLFRQRQFPVNGGQLRLQHMVRVIDGNRPLTKGIWLDVPVRQPGVKVTIPAISKDPRIVLKGYKLEHVQGKAGQNAKGQVWQLTLDARLTGKPQPKSRSPWNRSFRIVDGEENQFLLHGGRSVKFPTPQRQLIVQTFTFDKDQPYCNCGQKHTLERPLFITGSLQRGELWPLKIRLPFQNARNKVLVTRGWKRLRE